VVTVPIGGTPAEIVQTILDTTGVATRPGR
jgi:hypothetical protein